MYIYIILLPQIMENTDKVPSQVELQITVGMKGVSEFSTTENVEIEQLLRTAINYGRYSMETT